MHGRRRRVPWPLVVGALLDTDGTTFRRHGIASLPTTFFIDPSGVMADLAIGGPLTEEKIRAAIAKAEP